MNRSRHAKHRTIELFADNRLANRCLTLLERGRNDINVHVIDADSLRRQGKLSNCRTVRAVGDDAAIELLN